VLAVVVSAIHHIGDAYLLSAAALNAFHNHRGELRAKWRVRRSNVVPLTANIAGGSHLGVTITVTPPPALGWG
jgi:hypothetical protein